MIVRLLPFALIALAAPAAADERVFQTGSFERVRIDGPFEVRITTGGSPGAKASGDRQLIERISVAANGGTITVRLGSGGWGEAFRSDAAAPPVITLTTPRLTTIAVSAGARATVSRIAGQRIDLSVAGSSSLTARQVEADQLTAALRGSGALTMGGRAKRARLTSDGTGTIDAKAMTVEDLVVQLDGLGETRATAQRTAQVTTTGLGQVTVEGGAACTVRALAGGPVSCGTQRPR